MSSLYDGTDGTYYKTSPSPQSSPSFSGFTTDELNRLNTMTPFYYTTNKNADESLLRVITKVTRRAFHTEHLTISLTEDWEEYVFPTLQDLPQKMKQKIAESYRETYPKVKRKVEFFDEFRDANPELFI